VGGKAGDLSASASARVERLHERHHAMTASSYRGVFNRSENAK